MAILVGFVFNMSILISELMRTFGKQKSETALVQSITIGILYTAGAVSGKCLFRYGVRSTGIIGSILVSLGLILSFFANNIPHLIATIGVVSVYISAVTSIGEYFEEDSKLALSFLTFGSGCGCMVIPFLFHRLIEEFGWRGSLLILGGLMANAICGFAICKPVKIGPPSTTHEPNERLFIDLTGSYTKPLYGMSASLGFATCMLVFAAALKRKISNNNNSENES
ncbi:monocarboxylate transporter 14-like [Ylistrum balloti]|uniref:monocarboxylate transporter 14-like n=1 Tax=Ylistrum balloti TaxID=509963 RepID=UPI002905E1E2|nr:monocarboxylate transporter 14-like [Ylistrum balloti]